MDRISVLFVCMGNICRSPMAEAVFRHQVEQAGLTSRFEIDSAATHSYHLGSRPHERTQEQLRLNSVEIGEGRARLVEAADLERFDYVVAMDVENLANLQRLAVDGSHAQLSRLLDHVDHDVEDVPDPYYIGGYDRVYELVTLGCEGLLTAICEREGLELLA